MSSEHLGFSLQRPFEFESLAQALQELDCEAHILPFYQRLSLASTTQRQADEVERRLREALPLLNETGKLKLLIKSHTVMVKSVYDAEILLHAVSLNLLPCIRQQAEASLITRDSMRRRRFVNSQVNSTPPLYREDTLEGPENDPPARDDSVRPTLLHGL